MGRRYKEAQVACSEALKRFNNPHLRLEHLKLAAINRDWKVVLADSDDLLVRMPKFRPKIMQLRSQALVGLRRYAEAETILSKTIKDAPENRELLMERYKLYTQLGKKDLAEKDAKTIRLLDECL